MALNIITADQRLATPPKINLAIFGPSGVGKTTQARTLPPETTLFLDGEAGTLALGDWKGSTADIRKQAADMGMHPWQIAVGLACWLGGPDPTDQSGEYSPDMYARYCAALGDPSTVAHYTTIFIDSITVLGRWSFDWARKQPEAFSEKTGKPDTRGAYGLHGRQMIRWLTHIQHIANKSVIVVGILDKKEDDMKRVSWEPQIDGSKTSNELPGIFDEVLTLQNFTAEDGKTQFRAFCCHQQNPWNYPAKDRSGRLALLEAPNLGALVNKIRSAPRIDGAMATGMPATPVAA